MYCIYTVGNQAAFYQIWHGQKRNTEFRWVSESRQGELVVETYNRNRYTAVTCFCHFSLFASFLSHSPPCQVLGGKLSWKPSVSWTNQGMELSPLKILEGIQINAPLMWSNTICIVFIIAFTMRRSIPSSEMVFGLRNKFLRASLKHLIAPMTPME